MFITHATIYTINLQWNSLGEQAKMLGSGGNCRYIIFAPEKYHELDMGRERSGQKLIIK
jgi:hypothetical protein